MNVSYAGKHSSLLLKREKIKFYKTVGSSDSVVEQVTQDPKFEG
jgi:hypothetical protein